MKNSVIKRTEDYTENRKAYYRLPNSTTMEYLISHLNHSEGAVLRKGERVFITDLCLKGFITGVYEMTETPEETGYGYIECRLDLIAMHGYRVGTQAEIREANPKRSSFGSFCLFT